MECVAELEGEQIMERMVRIRCDYFRCSDECDRVRFVRIKSVPSRPKSASFSLKIISFLLVPLMQ